MLSKGFGLHLYVRGSCLINVFQCLKHDMITAQREDHNWEMWWQRNQLGGSRSKSGEALRGPERRAACLRMELPGEVICRSQNQGQ